MLSDVLHDSAFARWYLRSRRPIGEAQEKLRAEALDQFLESFDGGDIVSVDGVSSPVSHAIRSIHGDRPFEMNANWALTAQDWACPCCGRNKVAISRMGLKNQILAKLVVHHDHMGEVMRAAFVRAFVREKTSEPQHEGQRLVDRIGGAFSAYEHVLICEDCNQADGAAKNALGLPEPFSFSVGQIRRFIQVTAHASHGVDLTMARQVWEDARPAFELRMHLVQLVARAAATNEHWYEPHSRDAIPVPVQGHENAPYAYRMLAGWLNLDALAKRLKDQPRLHRPNRAKWRTTTSKGAPPLPANYLALLHSRAHLAQAWNQQNADWKCPVCWRTKEQQVYVGPKKELLFRTAVTSKGAPWRRQAICNHCQSLAMSLKEEVTDITGVRPPDSYSHVTPVELRRIIQPRPHASHAVKANAAAALVAEVCRRLRPTATVPAP